MLWLTTTMVSMVWADRLMDGQRDSSVRARTAALLDRVNALVQRIGDVPGRVVPLGKVQRGVDPAGELAQAARRQQVRADRKSTRLNSSHSQISYAVFCLKKKKR